MTTAAFKTLLRLTHGAILVTNPSWDVLDKGQQTLDFIEHRRPDMLARSTVACVDTPSTIRQPSTFDLGQALSRLGSRLAAGPGRRGQQQVIHIPYDSHIANGTAIHWSQLRSPTRRAALDHGGQFADIWSHSPSTSPRSS